MLILALDTTSEWGGAAIFRRQDCLAAAPHQGAANYSVSLFEDVDRLTAEAGIELGDIELFAAANGPGSFTGIRVGLAAAQAWAHAFGKPVRGVSVLEAMTEAARAETQYGFPLLDARRGEFYAGAFSRIASVPETSVPSAGHHPSRFVASSEAVVLRPESLKQYLQTQVRNGASAALIVRDQDAAAQALRASLPSSFQWKTIGGFLVPSIARLALLAEEEGRTTRPQELSAFYIRRSDAELNWRD